MLAMDVNASAEGQLYTNKRRGFLPDTSTQRRSCSGMLSGKQLPDTDVTDITDITDIHVAKVVAKIATCCGENLIGLTAAQAAHNKHMNFGQIWTCHPAMPGIVQSLGKLKSNKALEAIPGYAQPFVTKIPSPCRFRCLKTTADFVLTAFGSDGKR